MIDRNKLLAFKHSLQNEIQKKYGGYVEVAIQGNATKKVNESFVVSVIINGDIFNTQQYEIYETRKGEIHWYKFNPNFRENTIEKEVA